MVSGFHGGIRFEARYVVAFFGIDPDGRAQVQLGLKQSVAAVMISYLFNEQFMCHFLCLFFL